MRIGVIGAGNMGKAVIGGMLKKYSGSVSIVAHDTNKAALDGVGREVEISAPETWLSANVVPSAILVAVKPADLVSSLTPLAVKAAAFPDLLWCSIAAGISIATIEKALGTTARICRAMPNTPALVGEGISAFSLNKNCSIKDGETARYILGACGKVVEVPEKLMNAVTGLSGSGPAYVFSFIEALIEGGVAAVLPYQIARESAVQTVIGAGRMMDISSEDPGALRAKVMSPGGTTSRGILALEQNNFKYAVMKAVMDATKRAEELGT
jgi:pyrroline-5-carboxylate reductase